MPALDLLLSRRSISPVLLTDPGPSDAEINAMIEVALRAPDHGNLRPWAFAIVRGDARQRLGDVFAEALGFAAPDRLVGFVYVGTPPEALRPVERPAVEAHAREWTGPVPAAVRAA